MRPARRATPATVLALLAGAMLGGCTPSVIPPPATPAAGSPGPSTVAAATPTSPGSTDAPSPAPGPARCSAEAAALDLRRQVGQLIMVGVEVDAPQRDLIERHHLGSAIVMGSTPGGVAQVAGLARTLRRLGGDTGMLVAADQEGGLVQRLKGPGFPVMPSAATQATLSDATLASRAAGWGRALFRAGVRLDLAPVADVVPEANRATNHPVARLGRGYGSKPATVSAKVEAFRSGLAAAGVGAAVKHFPGLGAVRGNTDFATKVVDRSTTADSPLLRPFRDAVRAKVSAVMVSSATYSRIDASRPAVFSPRIIGVLREWGFDGVVVSDDLGAAAALSAVPPSRRAVRFIEAGGDLALTVDPSAAGAMADGLYRKARTEPTFAARVTESAARVLALKESLGLTACA